MSTSTYSTHVHTHKLRIHMVHTEVSLWFFRLFQDKITSFSRLLKAFFHVYGIIGLGELTCWG